MKFLCSSQGDVLREETCVGRERNPLRNPGKSGVCLGLELCYGEGHHGVPDWDPCATQQLLTSYQQIYTIRKPR
ncbi:hypothetical protein CapIbe_021250 [Capra ibex]